MRCLSSVRCLLALCAAALILAACDNSNPVEIEPPPPSITGDWIGTVEVQEEELAVSLTLVESQTFITDGSGTVDTLRFEVNDGSYVHPLISLTLLFPDVGAGGNPVGTLSATVSEERDEIRGSMGGPRFGGGPVTLLLQRRAAP